jgi:subtilisin family serine protease
MGFTGIVVASLWTLVAAQNDGTRAIVIDGTRMVVDTKLDRLTVRVPSGASVGDTSRLIEDVTAKARLVLSDIHVVRGDVLAVVFAEDLPFVVLQQTQARIRDAVESPVWTMPARSTGVVVTTDELLVTALPGQLDAVLRTVVEKTGGSLVRMSLMPNTALVRVGAAVGFDAVGASAALFNLDGAVSIEPNLLRKLAPTAIVNDPAFGDQWHLARNASQNVTGAGQIFIEGAWDITKGDPDTVIAIVDSGTDMTHPDLVANVRPELAFDAIDNDSEPLPGCTAFENGNPDPSCPQNAPLRESHGTSVAGLAAAVGDNNLGVSGVCPNCSMMPVRLIGGVSQDSLTIAETFVRVVDAGADVINNSWGPGISGFFPLSTPERDAFAYARRNGRGGKGAVVVFGAANDRADVAANPYASAHGVIAVAASTNLDDWAAYSNYGDEIDIAAPSQGDNSVLADGAGIVTTDVSGATGYSTGDVTNDFSGTSASAPIAAGLVGLVLSANPNLTAEQVRLILTSTADKLTPDVAAWRAAIGADVLV